MGLRVEWVYRPWLSLCMERKWGQAADVGKEGRMRAKGVVIDMENGRVTLAVHVGVSEKLKIDIHMAQLFCS